MNKIILLMLLLALLSCGGSNNSSNNSECSSGASRCHLDKVERCICGEWVVWDDCPALRPGEGCLMATPMCSKMWCQSDKDCTPWRKCLESQNGCYPDACSTDSDCIYPGTFCQLGYCVP